MLPKLSDNNAVISSGIRNLALYEVILFVAMSHIQYYSNILCRKAEAFNRIRLNAIMTQL